MPPAANWARTVGIGRLRPMELQSALAELTAQVFAACRDRFPVAHGYRHRIDRDRGTVEGQRLHVERGTFKGVVAVQWYARVHSYRQARDGGLEVRIGGRARTEPIVATPRRTDVDAHVPGRVLGLAAAVVLGFAGVHTVRLVMAHPSFEPVLDVLGIALAVLEIFAAAWLVRVAAIGRWWHRRAGAPVIVRNEDHEADLERWRDLGSDVNQLSLSRDA